MNNIYFITIESWYQIIAMLILAIVSIKAYRSSLKKVFILFMIISIPTCTKSLYTKINIFSLKTFHNSIPNIILGRDIRDNSRHRTLSGEYAQFEKEKSDTWNDAFKKENELKQKYADAIAAHKKTTWLKDLWFNIRIRLSSWLFPIAAIIICLQEIKRSNQWVDPTLLNARESAIRARQGAGHP